MKKELICIRCGHTWIPYVRKPKKCPVCRSPYWNTPYTRKHKTEEIVTPEG